jgi:hypothetical protein
LVFVPAPPVSGTLVEGVGDGVALGVELGVGLGVEVDGLGLGDALVVVALSPATPDGVAEQPATRPATTSPTTSRVTRTRIGLPVSDLHQEDV